VERLKRMTIKGGNPYCKRAANKRGGNIYTSISDLWQNCRICLWRCSGMLDCLYKFL